MGLTITTKRYDRIYRTRYDILGFARIDRTTWMFISLEEPEDPRQVGPQYASKAELLADLTRYATEVWGL